MEQKKIHTVTYIYTNGSLNDEQIKSLNDAINSYNNTGGKNGVKVKNADSSASYVKYNMNTQGVDNVDEERLKTGFETASGETRYYGNIVGTAPSTSGGGDEYGSAHNYRIDFNTSNMVEGIQMD